MKYSEGEQIGHIKEASEKHAGQIRRHMSRSGTIVGFIHVSGSRSITSGPVMLHRKRYERQNT